MQLPKRFFITGTDTEIGKTYVACKILEMLKTKGKTVEAIKPLVSGGFDDIKLLSNSSTGNITNRYLHYFPQAIAPHIAAKEANISLKKSEIVSFMNSNIDTNHVLIEGFGGWYAPISDQITMAECVSSARIPVILVVGMKLGCINHAVLTARAIKNDGCDFIGWIANTMAPPCMPYITENITAISKLLNKKPITTI